MGKSSQRVCQVGDKGGRQGKEGKAIYCEKELFLVRLNWRQADVVGLGPEKGKEGKPEHQLAPF